MTDETGRTPAQRQIIAQLSAWRTNHEARDELIRKGRDAKLTHEEIAALLGLSRPTVANVLNSPSSSARGLPEELTTDGAFDMAKYEALLGQRHSRAREEFWRNESADLPAGTRPVSWHATVIDARWDTGVPDSDSGVEPMLRAAAREMVRGLPGPVLVRRVRVDQAREMGFGTGSDRAVVMVAVHYELAKVDVYVRRREQVPPEVQEQMDELREAIRLGGSTVRALATVPSVEERLSELDGHTVTVTVTGTYAEHSDESGRPVTSTKTGVLVRRRNGNFVLAKDRAAVQAFMSVVPGEVEVIIDHGAPGWDADSGTPEELKALLEELEGKDVVVTLPGEDHGRPGDVPFYRLTGTLQRSATGGYVVAVDGDGPGFSQESIVRLERQP